MKKPTRKALHGIQLLLLLVTASSVALANESSALFSGLNTPVCYCHCEHEKGSKHCTKMCELPKYENRWWANSCHKKMSSKHEMPSPASNSGSKKTNRTELAQK